MRTIELSEEKARTLADYLAGPWADRAVRVFAANVPGCTPYRHMGESMTSRDFKARVAARKREMAAMGAVLEALGVQLPTVDRATIVAPYKSPVPGSKTVQLWHGPGADKERARIVQLIREQLA